MYCVNGRHCNPTHQRAGLVEGREVKDIVLDTGCSRTIVHHSLVPEKKLVTGEAGVRMETVFSTHQRMSTW